MTNVDPKVKGIPFHSSIFYVWHHLKLSFTQTSKIIRVVTVGYWEVVGTYNKISMDFYIQQVSIFLEAWCTGKLSIPTRQASLPKMLAQCCALPRPTEATLIAEYAEWLFWQVLGV